MSNESKAIDLTRVIARSYPIFQHIPIPTEQNISTTRHVWYDDVATPKERGEPVLEGAFHKVNRTLQEDLGAWERHNFTQIFSQSIMSNERTNVEAAELAIAGYLLGHLEWSLINGRASGPGSHTKARSMAGVLEAIGGCKPCPAYVTNEWAETLPSNYIFLISSGTHLGWSWDIDKSRVVYSLAVPKGAILAIDPKMIEVKTLIPFHPHAVTFGEQKGLIGVTGEYTAEIRAGHEAIMLQLEED